VVVGCTLLRCPVPLTGRLALRFRRARRRWAAPLHDFPLRGAPPRDSQSLRREAGCRDLNGFRVVCGSRAPECTGPTPDLYRRAATYVDIIFKGATGAGRIACRQPTKFEFVGQPRNRLRAWASRPASLFAPRDQVMNERAWPTRGVEHQASAVPAGSALLAPPAAELSDSRSRRRSATSDRGGRREMGVALRAPDSSTANLRRNHVTRREFLVISAAITACTAMRWRAAASFERQPNILFISR